MIKKWFLKIRQSPGNVPLPLCTLLKTDVTEVSQLLRSKEKGNSQIKNSVC